MAASPASFLAAHPGQRTHRFDMKSVGVSSDSSDHFDDINERTRQRQREPASEVRFNYRTVAREKSQARPTRSEKQAIILD